MQRFFNSIKRLPVPALLIYLGLVILAFGAISKPWQDGQAVGVIQQSPAVAVSAPAGQPQTRASGGQGQASTGSASNTPAVQAIQEPGPQQVSQPASLGQRLLGLLSLSSWFHPQQWTHRLLITVLGVDPSQPVTLLEAVIPGFHPGASRQVSWLGSQNGTGLGSQGTPGSAGSGGTDTSGVGTGSGSTSSSAGTGGGQNGTSSSGTGGSGGGKPQGQTGQDQAGSQSRGSQASQNQGHAKRPAVFKPHPVQASSGPQVLIYHTHTHEAYLKPDYDWSKFTGMQAFSSDPTKSVVAVGDVIASKLKQDGLNVIHDTTVYDINQAGQMSRINAYPHSRKGVSKILKEHPSIKVMLDIHRDYLGLKSAQAIRRRLVTTVNGQKVARLQIVIGDGKHLSQPHWKANLAFAKKFEQLMNTLYPGVFRGIDIKDYNYNQDLLPGALLIEVGGAGNTVEQAKRSGALIADVIDRLYKEGWVPVYSSQNK